MRKSNVLLRLCVVLALGMMVLGCGCGKDEDPNAKYKAAEQNTLFVGADKSVINTVIDSLDKEYYDSEELKTFINEEIREYNYSIPAEVVSIVDLSIDDTGKTAKVILKYISAEHYEGFNQESLFVGTITEAMEAGYDFETQFRKYDSLSDVALADAVYDVKRNVVIIEPAENMVINVSGAVKFIGADIKEIDKATVQVPANCRSYIIYE